MWYASRFFILITEVEFPIVDSFFLESNGLSVTVTWNNVNQAKMFEAHVQQSKWYASSLSACLYANAANS